MLRFTFLLAFGLILCISVAGEEQGECLEGGQECLARGEPSGVPGPAVVSVSDKPATVASGEVSQPEPESAAPQDPKKPKPNKPGKPKPQKPNKKPQKPKPQKPKPNKPGKPKPQKPNKKPQKPKPQKPKPQKPKPQKPKPQRPNKPKP